MRHFIEIISKKNNLKFIKKNIKLNEAYKADECFITATGWGICPIRSLDKKIFQKNFSEYKVLNLIQNEYSKIVGLDFVKQYLKF